MKSAQSLVRFPLLGFSGFGRKVMQTVKHGASPVELENYSEFSRSLDHLFFFQESGGKWRKMVEVMDYSDPEPNTNPRSGYLLSPPPPPPRQG
ncbi:hypothetical protein EUGRSUZ_J01355 [Eucalyptus grandis]|uniref:Uncharacterized protein n=2 Tax=Eucalyptus grandis TaxID=71139 RepID=A0ACC3J5T5_EUCGR|nr:hypothetical protein EUGRSUZ_J01355 [Eucalyptus grandis]